MAKRRRQCTGVTTHGRRCRQRITDSRLTCGQCVGSHWLSFNRTLRDLSDSTFDTTADATPTLSPATVLARVLGKHTALTDDELGALLAIHQHAQPLAIHQHATMLADTQFWSHYQHPLPGWFLQRALDTYAELGTWQTIQLIQQMGVRLYGARPADSTANRARDHIDNLDFTALHQAVRDAAAGRDTPQMTQALVAWPHNPERDSELSDWLMATQSHHHIHHAPSAAVAIAGAAWVSAGYARRGEVWDWHNNPHAVTLAEHPDNRVRRQFVHLLTEPPYPGWEAHTPETDGCGWELPVWRDSVERGAHLLPWWGYDQPGGLAEAYRRMHDQPGISIRSDLRDARMWLRHVEWMVAANTPEQAVATPHAWGTPVSQPHGTWTDIDVALLTDPALTGPIDVCGRIASADEARRAGVGVDWLPPDTVQAGLDGRDVWSVQLCEQLADRGYFDPTQHREQLLQHPDARMRLAVLNGRWGVPPPAAVAARCGDNAAEVRLAAAQQIISDLRRQTSYGPGDVARTPVELMALQYDPNSAIARTVSNYMVEVWGNLNDDLLAPHIDTDLWRTNMFVRRAAAAVTQDQALLVRLARERSGTVVEPMLRRNDLPVAALLALQCHPNKRIRAAAAKQLATH